MSPSNGGFHRARVEQSAELNRCFHGPQDNEVLLRPAGCESLRRSRLETPDRAPGAAAGTVGPVRGGMVAVSARPLGAGGGWGGGGGVGESQTVAAALRIDWIAGRIEAEQQKWVSLQAPADAGPDPPARGRLAGRRGGGCPAG